MAGEARFLQRRPRAMRTLLRLAVAFLIALLGLGWASAPSQGAAGFAAHECTYNSAASSSVLNRVETERGPPSYDYEGTSIRSAVDRGSHGVVRRGAHATSCDTTYDSTAQPVQVDNPPTTTRPLVGEPTGDLSSPLRSHVAANGGSKALNWSRATINDGGVSAVERHLARFESGPGESAMLDRLRSIARGDLAATDYDLRFYTHELRESVLYRKAGFPSGQPADGAYELWDQLHTQALTDYGLTRGGAPMDLFHPSARP